MSEDTRNVHTGAEAWAAAQVEDVVRSLDQKQRRQKKATTKARGIFFRERSNGEVVGPKGQRGEWWVCWFDTDSRKRREKAGSRAAAVALYQRRKTEVRQGKHFPESMRRVQAASLRAICDDYVAALKANHRDRRGQAAVRLAEVCEILGPRTAGSVTPQDVERLKAKLAETPARGRKDPEDPEKECPRTPASVNRFIQDLRAAYNLARRNGMVEKNPVADVKLLRENNKRIREMMDAEERALLEALNPATRRGGTDLRPLVRLLLETGLRLGEACAMGWADVDWTGGFLTLPETKAQETQHIPLSSQAVAILRALGPGDLSAACLRAARKQVPAQAGGYVFAWKDGRPWSEGYVTHAFGKAVKRAGITDLHAHDCRHTFACRKLRAGVDLYTVSKLLRHASIAMTERYTHLSRRDLKAAVERSGEAQ